MKSSGADLARAAPLVFVLLWSTGFVVARYATRDAGPLTFLAVRLVIAGSMLWGAAALRNAPRLDRAGFTWAAITGQFLNTLYLGGVFVAIHLGLPTGLSALIAGIHPVITSVAGRWVLRERLRRVQWAGIGLGLLGVVAVVVDRLRAHTGSVSGGALAAMAVSVAGMSGGTLLQRARGSTMPLLRGTAVQFFSAGVVLMFGAVLNEHWQFHPSAQLWLSLSWAILVQSIATVLIMLMLLQRQAAARVSSLFFLTPALSTIEGAILFSEHIGAIVVVGLFISLGGVFLTTRTPAPLPVA